MQGIEPVRQLSVAAGDGAMFPVRVYGRASGPRLILSHGNGFAIDGYRNFWRHLCARCEVVVFDIRNHGQNPAHGPDGHDWATFAHDFDAILTAIATTLAPKPTVGLFHSLSSIAALLHLKQYNWPWAGLILFEPPILPPADHPLHDEARQGELAIREWALARPDDFDSPETLASSWTVKRTFQNWESGTHLAMVKSILRQDTSTGRWRLRCPRELEAKIYDENRHSHLWRFIGAIPFPLLLYAGDPNRASGAITARLSAALAHENNREIFVQPNGSHLPMLEDSFGCAQTALNYLERIGVLKPGS